MSVKKKYKARLFIFTFEVGMKRNYSEPIKDVEAYEELSRQLFLELVDLNNTKERIKESKTIKGRYFNFLGYFFSLYCAYKIVMCTGKNFDEHPIRQMSEF